MSNHYYLVLHMSPSAANDWSAYEVALSIKAQLVKRFGLQLFILAALAWINLPPGVVDQIGVFAFRFGRQAVALIAQKRPGTEIQRIKSPERARHINKEH